MANRNTGDSSRQPSGSSTHSGAHSPINSPNNAQSQRKLAPSAAGNMFGVGMSNANNLKGLNSGWQVWGPATPSSKRNTSVSSVASVTDLSSSQGEPNYRGNLGEGWTTSRPTSGTWDEPIGSPQKKDYSHLESHGLALHQARQRQATAAQAAGFSVARADERPTGSKTGQFSPQRYETGLAKESRYPTTSPAGYDAISFPAPQTGPQSVNSGGGYESLHTSSFVDNNLSLAIRGMAMDDDYNGGRPQIGLSQPSGMAGQMSNHPIQPPPIMQQHRGPYNAYPQTDYSTYYTNPPATESYMDYQYASDAYRGTSDSVYPNPGGMSSTTPPNIYSGVSPQPLHPDAVADLHRQQSSMFYHYGAAARPPGSQFFYPGHQGMVYPPSHSPMLTPQLGVSNHASLLNKKREHQYNIQQQIAPQNLMYTSLRSVPSPHLQAYAVAMDYGSTLPMMLPGGAMYGHGVNPRAIHIYQQGIRRRNDGIVMSMALRSPLLEEFRANKARKWELRDIFGCIVEFSGDQHGSRFIQQKLEGATSEEKQKVFDEVVPHNILQLIQDVFGNYVVQKLFEHGTQVQKTILANTMESHILPLSLQTYGCRVVQKAIEYILPDQQSAFIKELDVHVLKCVKDANGNHVIQKLVERVSPDRLAFVSYFRGNVFDLSTHPYGCRVLQRCLEHLPAAYTRPLLDELHRYTINLMQDQFGNYVIQFVLEHGQPQDRALVIMKLRGQVFQMSRHKFASNVCEKALLTADPESCRILIDEMMAPKPDGTSPIQAMMKDQFANYVLQRALGVVEGQQKEALINMIRPQLANMRQYSSAYSKHLVSIERLLEKYGPAPEHEHDLPNISSELIN